MRHESVEAKGERITVTALQEWNWREGDLGQHPKAPPAKLALAARLRRETTLTVREIAGRLQMGSWKSLNNKLYLAGKLENKSPVKNPSNK